MFKRQINFVFCGRIKVFQTLQTAAGEKTLDSGI